MLIIDKCAAFDVVILSEVRSSRSDLLAQSRDPYNHPGIRALKFSAARANHARS